MLRRAFLLLPALLPMAALAAPGAVRFGFGLNWAEFSGDLTLKQGVFQPLAGGSLNNNLSALPLTIQNFPWNGGANDFLKVCLLNANGGPTNCCRVAEFPVPGCLFSAPCEIFDLKVIKTPCLCGQFFAIVTFQHSGGGNAGFKIVGNGVNYGNYPYNTPQPIILGPLDGDNMTNYEFAVVDLQIGRAHV
jgi:hypothetical protein